MILNGSHHRKTEPKVTALQVKASGAMLGFLLKK
jgi:hypothetical protein